MGVAKFISFFYVPFLCLKYKSLFLGKLSQIEQHYGFDYSAIDSAVLFYFSFAEYVADEVLPYEEVALLEPNPQKKRPVVLIGQQGNRHFDIFFFFSIKTTSWNTLLESLERWGGR